jgi:cystathionine gamma-lyase
VLAFVRKGDHVVSIRDLYGGTFQLMSEFLPAFGVETTLVETTDLHQMRRALRPNTKLVYVESPTNPTLKLVDIAKASKIAHRAGALLLADNTFASPINQLPLELGADVSLHSATKYLNGHADVSAGAAAASEALVSKIKMLRRILGGTLDPHASWLVLRGMKTMALRVRAANENAQALAEFLAKHRRVKRVNYPGLKTHPQHALARKQMMGFGGMMSFELKGTLRSAMKFTERLRLPFLAASLGGVASLITQPAAVTHHQLTSEQRAKIGIPDTLIRLSVGIEDKDDLITDFKQALASV